MQASSLNQRHEYRSMRILTCCAARSRTWSETLFVTPPLEQPVEVRLERRIGDEGEDLGDTSA